MGKLTLSFRVYKNGQLVRAEKLTQNVIKLGKVASAHLQLDDESVSRMHAIIEVAGNDVSLIDLGSTRGTFVNGQKINKAKLANGDTITVGDLRIELGIAEEAPAVAVAAAPPPVPVAVPAPAPMLAFVAPPPVVQRTAAPVAPQGDAEDFGGGTRAVEVAAMLGDSVVSVKHCMDPKGGKITPATWGFFATGLACLLGSAIAFKSAVDTAAYNKGALEYHTQVRKMPAYSFRPTTQGPGVDFVMWGGLSLGLFGLTAGLVRARRERKSPFYRVGTAPGVEQPLDTAPSADFPLVAPSGEDFVFNYGAGFEGELLVDGTSTPLSELAQSGRARPSTTTAGAIEIPIPAKSKIRARSGNTTFMISSVAKPATQPVPLFSLNSKTMAYFAGSLAVHLGIWGVLQTVDPDAGGISLDLANAETTDIRGTTTEQDEPVPEEEQDQETGDSGNKDAAGAKMALDEGEAGDPNKTRVDSKLAIKNNQKEPSMSREQAIEQARSAGFLGDASALRGGVASLGAMHDFSSGFDNVDSLGHLFGSAGEGKGNFGGGISGFGIGGGCKPGEWCGIVGAGRYGTIGNGSKAGEGWGEGGNGHGRMRRHVAQGPSTDIGRPIIGGDLDRSIIRRYIRQNIDKISYCYEKQLLAKPGLDGTVSVQFLIAGNGSVQASSGSGLDSEVSGCVAGVIKNIKFPAPKNGGNVQVNYPFNFHPAGS
ncbi:MAG: AgmX/PglI C-terminal domain-containing protein [Kofleriaceae bacterium]